jgi:predicted GNAT family N-acyltransferase
MNFTKSNFRIIIPLTETELNDYYQLRYEVLRKPWGQPHQTVKDDWEDQSLHVLMVDENNKPVATGRLQFNADGEAQVRSMAVSEQHRGHGLGTEILRFIEREAINKKYKRIILDARDIAVKFYLKNGYGVDGESYTLFGVIPHFRMSKMLV